MLKSLVVIAGPTASGKSAMALALARAHQGTIINADASQLYRDLAIVSARPDAAEMAEVPHLLFGTIDGAQAMTAAQWAALAGAAVQAVQASGRLPILVGGTGLYLRTLLSGIAPVPAIDPAIRATVRAMTPEAVRTALESADPAMAARLHRNDRQRNARALEVWQATGRSLLTWQQAPATGGIAAAVTLDRRVITIDRESLGQRIDQRVEAMWAAGARDEVAALAARQLPAGLPVMRAIGVPPLLALLAGEATEAEALARWKLETRQYAKRQATWLRNQFGDWPRFPATGGQGLRGDAAGIDPILARNPDS